MIIKTVIKKGAYFDSVSLMQISKKINSIKGIMDSAVVMATKENKNIIKSSGLLTQEIEKASDNDLAIAVKGESEKILEIALKEIDNMLSGKDKNDENKKNETVSSIDSAVLLNPDINIALISVNGRYAGDLASEALDKGLNVMIFSDNVPLETEIKLKNKGLKKNLLVMGPDCGTAIINSAPLGFANKVNPGSIGVVGPSGTGIQEVTSIISNLGGGISQAIGTGTRDVKDEVGGITTVFGLNMLNEDSKTRSIIIVSKPPQKKAMVNILNAAKKIKKPIICLFLGSDFESKDKNIYTAKSLYEAALKALYISRGESEHKAKEVIFDEIRKTQSLALEEKKKKNKNQKYLRGLFSGGTFASQSLFVFKNYGIEVYSNIPIKPELKLKNSMKLEKNSIIDLGEDEFTFARPHPMIDYGLRNKFIEEESKDKEVSVLLLDIVLGYGSNLNPSADIMPYIKKAFKNNPYLTIVVGVTGTDMDPQNKKELISSLKKEGVFVFENNYLASVFAAEIIK